MAKAKIDTYPNKALERVTETAANTLTFQEVNFAAGVFQRIALVIHRVVYSISEVAWDNLVDNTDTVFVALTVSNGINDLAMTHPEIVDSVKLSGFSSGTPATGLPLLDMVIHDLSGLPGGGWIIPASPVYIAMDSGGIGAALNCDVEIDFTFIELADADYIELVQSRIKANV